jgi:hypothetical protein
MLKNKIHVVVDVESNGPAPGINEMTSFGAVMVDVVQLRLGETFYARLQTQGQPTGYLEVVDAETPIEPPYSAMSRFKDWLDKLANGAPNVEFVFVSDNPCFDWQFINYYFHRTIQHNPFGFSGRRIGDFWAGQTHNWSDQSGWRKLVKTPHTHHPTDDAVGHGEALLAILAHIPISAPIPISVPVVTDSNFFSPRVIALEASRPISTPAVSTSGITYSDCIKGIKDPTSGITYSDCIKGIKTLAGHGQTNNCATPTLPPKTLRPGDWLCPNCKVTIWASKDRCKKCMAKRP